MLPLVSLYVYVSSLLFCLSSDCSWMSLSLTDGPMILFLSSMKRKEMTRSCGCYWAYLLLIIDPYRIVSEEAQLDRVIIDLTKKTELFRTGGKESYSTASKKKKKKKCVNTHAMKYVHKGTCPVFSCWQSGCLPFVWQSVLTQQLGGLWMRGPTPTL